MEHRKLVRMGHSLGVTLPASTMRHMEIKAGDSCGFMLLKGGRVLVMKEGEKRRGPEGLELEGHMTDEARRSFEEFVRKVRAIENQAVDQIWMKITGLALRFGLNFTPSAMDAFSKQKVDGSGKGKVRGKGNGKMVRHRGERVKAVGV